MGVPWFAILCGMVLSEGFTHVVERLKLHGKVQMLWQCMSSQFEDFGNHTSSISLVPRPTHFWLCEERTGPGTRIFSLGSEQQEELMCQVTYHTYPASTVQLFYTPSIERVVG